MEERAYKFGNINSRTSFFSLFFQPKQRGKKFDQRKKNTKKRNAGNERHRRPSQQGGTKIITKTPKNIKYFDIPSSMVNKQSLIFLIFIF